MKVYHLQFKNVSLLETDDVFGIYNKVTFRGDVEKAKQILDGKVEDLIYVHVANVPNYYTKDNAFELTNSIFCYWGDNESVEDLTQGCRSTSAGDIIELDTGEKFLITDFDYVEIV
jgi:hypothetical protein